MKEQATSSEDVYVYDETEWSICDGGPIKSSLPSKIGDENRLVLGDAFETSSWKGLLMWCWLCALPRTH